VTGADPGRVLRLALLAWGLGHLALGRRRTGALLLAGEAAGLAIVAGLTVMLADSTAYLVPFLAGIAFLVAWTWQAVAAYRAARPADPAALGGRRSPAATIGWLSVPALAWSTGFWLLAAGSATPAAVVDRFVTDWTQGTLADSEVTDDIRREAERASAALADLCREGALRDGCDPSGSDPYRDVRLRVTRQTDRSATVVAEAVRFERRPSRFLGIFAGSELVPVPVERVLTLRLEAVAVDLPGGADIGARRWRLVEAGAG